MTILVALLALSIIILVHETGHYLAARAMGIKVNEFAIFMGPKLFSWKRNGTRFSVRAIPIGGFVSMEGEDEDIASGTSFSSKPAYKKIITILAGPLSNLLFALFILFFLFLFSGYALDRNTVMVENRPAYQQGLRDGDVIRRINGKKVYDPLDMTVLMYGFQGEQALVEYVRDGVVYEALLTPEKEGGTQYLINFTTRDDTNVVHSIPDDSNAYKAGLRPGDAILMINGIETSNRYDIREVMNANQEKDAMLTVARGDDILDLSVTPVVSRTPEYFDLGIYYHTTPVNVFQAFRHGVRFSVATIRSIYFSIIWLISGKATLSDMMGPVGIVSIIGASVRQPTFWLFLSTLLSMMAFISLNLGIINLIPFPALDGSKVIIHAIEGIRGKPFPVEKTAIVSLVGFGLLILLLILTTYNDIVRLFGGG
ncbi:MAG: RIP metalloprotease RseP [Clostridia bacterium]